MDTVGNRNLIDSKINCNENESIPKINIIVGAKFINNSMKKSSTYDSVFSKSNIINGSTKVAIKLIW